MENLTNCLEYAIICACKGGIYMEKDMKELIREGLDLELSKIDEGTARIRLDSGIIEEVLFDIDENGMKTFAFPVELMKKVNFEGISFDGFFAYGFDFTGFKGVSIDPQKVYDKNLSYSNLNGVRVINTFDDVNLEGINTEGMIYDTFKIRAKKYVKSMKK